MRVEIVCSLKSTGSFLLALVTFPRTFCLGAVDQFTKFKVTSPKICNLVGPNCSILANVYGRTTEALEGGFVQGSEQTGQGGKESQWQRQG